MECYRLPYGALGFASHLLTYYTLFCLWFHHRPLSPCSASKAGFFDIILALCSLLTTVILAVLTLVRCRNTWQHLVIGVWKLSMSLLNGVTASHAAYELYNASPPPNPYEDRSVPFYPLGRHHQKSSDAPDAFFWFPIYLPGLFAGFAGLMNLVIPHLADSPILNALTYTLFDIVGLGVVGFICYIPFMLCDDYPDPLLSLFTALAYSLGAFSVLSALYSDWVLGILVSNIAGLPSSDSSAFYWGYFVAKRLVMLSW